MYLSRNFLFFCKTAPLWRGGFAFTRYQHKSAAEPFLNGTSASYIEYIYAAWLKEPKSVHKSWDVYFRGVSNGAQIGKAYSTPPTLGFEQFDGIIDVPQMPTTPHTGVNAKIIEDHLAVQVIIRSYQVSKIALLKLQFYYVMFNYQAVLSLGSWTPSCETGSFKHRIIG